MAQKIASMFAEIGVDTSKFDRGAKQVKTGLFGLKQGFSDTLKVTASFTAGLFAIRKAYDATVGVILEYNNSIREGSQVTGMAVEEFSRLVQVGDDWGITAESITASLAMMRQRGMQPSINTLADLADKFVEAGDSTAFAEEAASTLGRGWKTLVPLLAKGGDALRDQAAAVDDALVVTEESIKMTEDYRFAVDALTDAWQGFAMTAAKDVLPFLTDLLKELSELSNAKTGGQVLAILKKYSGTFGTWGDEVQQTSMSLGGFRNLVTDLYPVMSAAAAGMDATAEGLEKVQDSSYEAASGVRKAHEAVGNLLAGIDTGLDNAISSWLRQITYLDLGAGSIQEKFEAIKGAAEAGFIDPALAKTAATETLVQFELIKVAAGEITFYQAAQNLAETLNIKLQDALNLVRTIKTEGAFDIQSYIRIAINPELRYNNPATNPANRDNGGGSTGGGTGGGGNQRAAGGPVMAGTSYIVGERGPELFTPGQSGGITPNNALMGGGDVYADITINAPAGMDVNTLAAAVVARLQAASRNNRAGGYARGG